MKRLFLVVAMVGAAAYAAETHLATVTGPNVQTHTVTQRKVSVQCPGQIIYYRPGTVSTSPDAGVGNVAMDFQSNPDPYRVDLSPDETKIYFANIDGGGFTCYVFRRST